jgi:hypothetical protein
LFQEDDEALKSQPNAQVQPRRWRREALTSGVCWNSHFSGDNAQVNFAG